MIMRKLRLSVQSQYMFQENFDIIVSTDDCVLKEEKKKCRFFINSPNKKPKSKIINLK